MPYIFAIIAALSFAAGGVVTYQFVKSDMQHMSDGIAAQNMEETLTFKLLTEQADKEHERALNVTKQLEDANVSTINTINNLRDSFKSKRLLDTHRARSSCTSATSVNSSITTNTTTTNDGELSNELTEFLKSEAYRADQVSAYATLCKNYIDKLRELDYVKLE